ncbi:MAG: hypothetical protein U9N54_04925, partial [candidate division Zixibacteria bacterium]|nr:hypothetical protein [candidate division Zixibacteria bacterium]
FDKQKPGNYKFTTLDCYARLFEKLEQDIMRKSNTGWRDSKKKHIKYAFFNNIIDNDVNKIESFIKDFQQFVLIGLNKNIKDYFNNEIFFCMALDFTFKEGSKGQERTDIYESVYKAKYSQCEKSMKELIKHLEKALKYFSKLNNNNNMKLIYMPSRINKKFDLPKELAMGLQTENIEVIDATLKTRKSPLKDIKVVDGKIAEWDKILVNDNIDLSKNIDGCDVIILDDLYQSGSSMWSFAKYLKQKGVNKVFGLTCVKNWSDSVN